MLKEETMNMRLNVDGDKARKEINDTIKSISDGQQKIKEINYEIAKLSGQGKTNTARYKELKVAVVEHTNAVLNNKKKLEDLRNSLSLNELTIKELTLRAKSLRKEMETLRPESQEWNRLNGELKATVSRMKELKGASSTAGNTISSIKSSSLVAVAAVAGVVRTIKDAFTTLRDETQKFGDVINREVAAADAVWHQFIRNMSASRGEITLTYQEVANLAREAHDLKDEIFELQNSYKILEAEATPRMQELEAVFRDTSKPIAERKAALEEMKEIELSLANDRLIIAQQQEDAAYDEFYAQTALERDAAEAYIHDYLEVKKSGLLEEVKAYEILKKQEENLIGAIQSGAPVAASVYAEWRKNLELVQTKIADATDEVSRFYETYRQYNLGNDPTTGAYAEAIAARIQAQAAASESAMDAKYARLNGQLSGSGNGSGGGGKSKQSWSLQSDATFLAAKAELIRKYNDDIISSQEEFDEKLYQQEVAALTMRLASHRDSAQDRLRLEIELQNLILKHKQAAAKKVTDTDKKAAEEKKALAELEKSYLNTYIAVIDDHEKKAMAQEKAENIRYKEELEKYQKKSSELKNYHQIVETLERQHQNNLRKIRLDAMEAARKDQETQHKINLAAIQERHAYELNSESTPSKTKAKLKRKDAYDTAAVNVAYLQAQVTTLDRIVSSGTANGNLDGLKLSSEELQKYQLQLLETTKQLKEAKAQLDGLEEKSFGQIFKDIASAGTGGGSFLGVTQSDWDLLFLNIEKGTFGAKDLVNILTGLGGAAQEGMKIATNAIGIINAKEKKEFNEWSAQNDKKKTKLEKRLEAGLVTQAQYNAEVEQMEADKAAREDELKTKQAKRDQEKAIIQAVIDTALSIAKTFAQFGATPVGIAAAAVAAAVGATQIALIKAQGFAEGGPVRVQRSQDGVTFKAKVDPEKRGYIDKPTILVGEEGGEYVIPAEALQNPQIRMVVDSIENARRMGRLRSLRMEAVSPAYAAVGRASGGYTQDMASSGATAADMSGALAELARMSETVDRLNTILENGIDANVSMLGPHGLVNKMNEYNRAKSRGNLYDRDTNQIRSHSGSRSGR